MPTMSASILTENTQDTVSTFQFRVSTSQKSRILNNMHKAGLNPSEIMRAYFLQFEHPQNIQVVPCPYPSHTPNARTAELLLMPDDQKGYTSFSSVADLMADLTD